MKAGAFHILTTMLVMAMGPEGNGGVGAQGFEGEGDPGANDGTGGFGEEPNPQRSRENRRSILDSLFGRGHNENEEDQKAFDEAYAAWETPFDDKKRECAALMTCMDTLRDIDSRGYPLQQVCSVLRDELDALQLMAREMPVCCEEHKDKGEKLARRVRNQRDKVQAIQDFARGY